MPLKGIRILDFTQFMSGPMCTLVLSDFGAEVIKIENPPKGDATRQAAIIEKGNSSLYAARNRGKKSIVLNMKDEKQRALFLKLVRTADAVVENFKPGTMEKLGISYEILREINPRLVFTSISGFGQDGPYAKRPAFDATIQAESGVMSITGEDGGEPLKCGAAIADFSGGMLGCIGTLLGIVKAQRTGEGCHIDVSMMDSLVFLLENQLSVYLKTGVLPQPRGNRYPFASPIGTFRCKDGEPVMINISTDAQWKAFAEALDQPQWLEEPDFATILLRAQNYKAVEAEVNRVFSQYTSAEVIDRLQAKNSIYGKVNSFADLASHPQLKHRGMIVNAVYRNGAEFQVPGDPIHISEVSRAMDYPVAELGQDTRQVLSEVADPAELADLERLFAAFDRSAE